MTFVVSIVTAGGLILLVFTVQPNKLCFNKAEDAVKGLGYKPAVTLDHMLHRLFDSSVHVW